MKKTIRILITVLISLYVLVCVLLYFFQEKLIFIPEKLDKEFVFAFNQPFEEMNIQAKNNVMLNGILFKSDSAKGLVFYLHGNAGSLRSWGQIAKLYTDLNYDLFMPDYRGYGKSDGTITGQDQLYSDVQTLYNEMKTMYDENKIIVIGNSIGTGPAAWLASVNHPRMLILQAPYYSFNDLMRQEYLIIPVFILKYKLETNEYIKECKMPVVIFHGDNDEIINHKASVKLKAHFKQSDRLILLPGQGHNGMADHPLYREEIKNILTQ